MRLPVDRRYALLALGLSASLAGCNLVPGGADQPRSASSVPKSALSVSSGPAADYPMVLGGPFTVDGTLYTPVDTLNYDAVGYAAVDDAAGFTAAHKTLPLPSYVEVTSLATGKTIIARVERRGPMTGAELVSLSPDAAAELGERQGAPVRVRRVNPVETTRAELRAGRAAPEPMATPKGLLEALRRKLPPTGFANLREGTSPPTVADAAPTPTLTRGEVSPAREATVVRATTPAPSHSARPATQPADKAGSGVPRRAPPPATGGYFVQAGTFAVRANAQKVANAIGGSVSPAGTLFRVRSGPFPNRGQAEAALAKVRAAGYSDARVFTAG